MRHIRSILYAVVLGPAVWVLMATGLNQDLTTRGQDRFAVESFGGFLLLLLAGIAYGILLMAPISPAGPALLGAVYLGAAVWAIYDPGNYASLWPAEVTKEGFNLSRPGFGLAAIVAVPLLLTALSARRWAKYEPPVLPFIGQIGRARGSAAVVGSTPAAVLETTVLRLPANVDSADTTVVARPDEPTVAVSVPADNKTQDEEKTQFVRMPGDHTRIIPQFSKQESEDATQVIRPQVAVDDEATTPMAIPAPRKTPEQ